jgi:hypothetical protein
MEFTKWWEKVRNNTRALFKSNSPVLTAGLYTFPIALDGGQRRIHLRIDAEGAGVLFVDVTDVIHLNKTAAQMAKLALDEVPLHQAKHDLLRHYRGINKKQLTRELTSIYEMVNRLCFELDTCPTCEIKPIWR